MSTIPPPFIGTNNNLSAEIIITDLISQHNIIDILLSNLAYGSVASVFVPYQQLVLATTTITLPAPLCFHLYVRNVTQAPTVSGGSAFNIEIGSAVSGLVGGATGTVTTVALFPGDVFMIWENPRSSISPGLSPGFTSLAFFTGNVPAEVQYFIGA